MPEVHPDGLDLELEELRPIPLSAQLRCAPGELLALVGPSGSGKTTLLRAIAGLHREARGRVTCAGEIWQDSARRILLSPQQRSVGYVFQSYALFPHLTALDNVKEGLRGLAPRERDARAADLLARVRLTGLELRRPAELSGGQQQRVAVARALARDPKVLLLDEPFSAVDEATRQKLYRELALLRRDLGMPVLLVTHALEEATLLADTLMILHRGQTLQSGPPLEVTHRPRSALVARLVGLRNLFEGRVLEHREHEGCTLIDWPPYTLRARLDTQHGAGQRVIWAIATARVVLLRRERPSSATHENPVSGIVRDLAVLGERSLLTVTVTGAASASLSVSVPTHLAHRAALAAGQEVTFSLQSDGIHLMPWERDALASEDLA